MSQRFYPILSKNVQTRGWGLPDIDDYIYIDAEKCYGEYSIYNRWTCLDLINTALMMDIVNDMIWKTPRNMVINYVDSEFCTDRWQATENTGLMIAQTDDKFWFVNHNLKECVNFGHHYNATEKSFDRTEDDEPNWGVCMNPLAMLTLNLNKDLLRINPDYLPCADLSSDEFTFDYIGRWVLDVVELTDEKPSGYTEIHPRFPYIPPSQNPKTSIISAIDTILGF